MNWFQIAKGVRQIWEDRPDIIALLALGFVLFGYVVLDARKWRQREKSKRSQKY